MMTVCSAVVNTLTLFMLIEICVYDVKCRQFIKPTDDIENESKIKEIGYSEYVNRLGTQTFSTAVGGTPCSLNTQKDLPKPNEPQPLYINPKTNEIWMPNRNGYLEIPSGATIELYCSQSFANTTNEDEKRFIPKNTKTIKPICLTGKTFVWRGKKYEFHQFICKKQYKYTVERIGEKCAAQTAELFRVGFNLTENRFIETMRICYDSDTMRNYYTKHHLLPGNLHFQRDVNRLNFSKAGFFDKHNVNFYYTQKNQQKRALELFGNNETVKKIFSGQDLFLARGHLAAKSDYVYANQQRATFTFLNVAPQWQSFNSGQWAAMEDEVRKFVMKQQIEVDCYTGTWGTLKLRPPNSTETTTTMVQEFYLAKDENNNEILPVPQLYYRIIIDRHNTKRGIVLLGVNNPHTTLHEIQDDYLICRDITAEVSWLHWIRNKNLKKGFMYACNVSEFVYALNILPNNLKYTNELLI